MLSYTFRIFFLENFHLQLGGFLLQSPRGRLGCPSSGVGLHRWFAFLSSGVGVWILGPWVCMSPVMDLCQGKAGAQRLPARGAPGLGSP